jgi:hypothetical protein
MLPDVPAFAKKFTAKEASVVIFNTEKTPKSGKTVKAFYQQKKVNIPVFAADRDFLVKYCDLKLFPGMWVIDNNGKIVAITANNLDDVLQIIYGKLGKEVDKESKERAKKPVQT